MNGNTFAKFLGEKEPGDIDGRKIRNFNFPDVYRQWIDYWRECIDTGKMESLVESSGSHYRVIGGGELMFVIMIQSTSFQLNVHHVSFRTRVC